MCANLFTFSATDALSTLLTEGRVGVSNLHIMHIHSVAKKKKKRRQ